MKWIKEFGKIIFVYREVDSVMKSFYSYAQTFSHAADVPITDFIRQEYCGRRSRPAYWAEMIKEWTNKNDVLSLHYNDLIEYPERALNRMDRFLDIKPLFKSPILPKPPKSLNHYRLERIFSTNPQSTAILGSGNSEKPRLSEQDIKFIRSEVSAILDD